MPNTILEMQLRGMIVDIDRSIARLMTDAREMQISAIDMKYVDGSYPIIPLFAAKAQCLNGLAVLKASEKK